VSLFFQECSDDDTENDILVHISRKEETDEDSVKNFDLNSRNKRRAKAKGYYSMTNGNKNIKMKNHMLLPVLVVHFLC
jgi:hypothetical protein